MAVVSLPRYFVFRLNVGDPHPIPWIRVKLSCAMGDALYPHPQWKNMAALWESFYPRTGLGEEMLKLQGWTDVSVREFNTLGRFGEQILLSIRFGAWSTVHDPVQAANWARFWRAEIQGYVHSYRAVTGVDLTSEITDTRQAAERFLQPSVHLRNRLSAQRQPR